MSDTDPRPPDRPDIVHLAGQVELAAAATRPFLRNTPLWRAPWLDGPQCKTWLKLENLQHTGSFKVRGATNFLVRNREQLGDVVVAASTGNHGAAVAFAASRFGVGARVFVPASTSPTKLQAMEFLGAEIRKVGEDAVESELAARRHADEHGERYVSPYNDLDVIAGQGTIAVELLEALDRVDAIVASVGGGGLIAGVAARLRVANPGTRIIAVSPEASAVMAISLRTGHIVDQVSRPTLSDATAGGIEPAAVTFELCRSLIDDFQVVGEDEIALGVRDLLFRQRVLGEGAAGCAVAGLRRVLDAVVGNVVVILCGGNIAPRTLAEVVAVEP
jgi:threonine dehydratase